MFFIDANLMKIDVKLLPLQAKIYELWIIMR